MALQRVIERSRCFSVPHFPHQQCPADAFPLSKKKRKKTIRDFPGGAVVKSLSANAGDTGLSPGLERSHMPRSNEARAPQLLSLRSRAREPQLLSPRATTTEARAPRARAP